MEIPEVQKYLTTTFDNVKAIGDLTEIHNRRYELVLT
jgi:NAD(P)H-nitrite reductase large subunit